MAHSPETKAAVLAALMEGQGVNAVARAHGLDKSIVSRWKSELGTDRIQQIATEKKERLIDLVEDHLTASLKAATKLAGQADDDEWRAKQPASEIAVFYGVLSDKAIRLIEIAGRILGERAGE